MNYILLIILSYLGLATGVIISYFAKEELKPGKKYFQKAIPLIYGTIVFITVKFYEFHFLITIIVAIIAIIITYYLQKFEVILYSFSVIFLFLNQSVNYVPKIALLIFVYGLLVAGIEFNIKNNILSNLKQILLKNITFLIVGILLSLF